MTREELLERYAAGERDVRGVILQYISLDRFELEGVDFTGAIFNSVTVNAVQIDNYISNCGFINCNFSCSEWGCVAKIGAAGDRVRDYICSHSSPCPNPTPLNGGTMKCEMILLCVRWYLTYPLSYRQVAEMVNERGEYVHHTTIHQWVQRYALLIKVSQGVTSSTALQNGT